MENIICIIYQDFFFDTVNTPIIQFYVYLTNPNKTQIPMLQSNYIYILTNKHNTVLYTGVTSDLSARLMQHKSGIHDNAFSKRYNITKLVYYEEFNRIEDAIAREKQLKAGNRQKKVDLINHFKPEWKDLSDRSFR
jgi:putative endonuclease